jgi:PHD-finger
VPVAGLLGAGSATQLLQLWLNLSFFMMQRKAEVDGDDGNADMCVLCGLGGNLLCCDGCPGAYHLRCIGESNRSIPEGEWLCPECQMGGKGKASGQYNRGDAYLW